MRNQGEPQETTPLKESTIAIESPADDAQSKSDDRRSAQSIHLEDQENELYVQPKDYVVTLLLVLGSAGVFGVVPDILDEFGLHTWKMWSLCVAFILAALAFSHGIATFRPAWAKRIWRSFTIVAILITSVFALRTYNVFTKSPKPDFIVNTDTVVVTPTRDGYPDFWMIHGVGDDRVITPIFLAMYVHFTNQKETAHMIKNYSVESKLPHGDWRSVRVIDIRSGTLVSGTDTLRQARVLEVKSLFNSVIQNKNIAPHETVQGWIFAQIAKEGYSGTMRLRVWDTVGSESVETIKILGTPSKMEILLSTTALTCRGIVDASHLPKAFLND